MNNILKTVTMCLCGAAVLSSCSDWLETSSTSLNDKDITFTSPALTKLAVNGAYGKLCGNNYTQLMTIHQGAGTDVELIDGIGSTATAASERGAMNYNATSGGWNKLGTLWEEQYAAIESCNLIIDGIAAKQDTIKAQGATAVANMAQYDAEAKTIRAMVYLDLIRVFGDVPMMLHSAESDLSNVNINKTGRDQILDSLIVDLEGVVEAKSLPEIGTVTSEHITHGYAEALLANIYMTRAGYAIREAANGVNADYCVDALKAKGYVKADYSDDTYQTMRPSDDDCNTYYTKAAAHLANVIKRGKYKMYDSFTKLWADINALKTDETYHESMFEIPMGFGNTGELGYTVGVRLNGDTNDYGYRNSSGKLKTTAVQLYSYGMCDTRRDITCVPYEIKNLARTEANGVKTTTIEACMGNKPFGLYIGKWDVRKMSDQWSSTNKTATAKFGYGINVVRMRYPQVLLWYAECMAQLGYLTVDLNGCGVTAKQALEKVHERAYFDAEANYLGINPTTELDAWKTEIEAISNTEDFMTKVRQENQLEFCGEGFRKWDLIRWNKLHEVIWNAKLNYKKFCGADGTRAIDKIYYKYTDDTEKQLDPSSFTWYGMPDGGTVPTLSKKGKSPSNDWLQENGYRYPKGTGTSAGQGTDAKGLNADSYTKAGFGQAYNNESSELNTICGGLVGTQKISSSSDECKDEEVRVKNRYLMPIYDNTIQSSNGRLYNSYGY